MSEPSASTGPERAAGAPVDPQLALAEWRARGALRLDPMRLDYVEALARRAAAHDGEVRCLLDGRLAAALAGFGQPQRSAASRRTDESAASPPAPVRGGPLADLLRHLALHSADGRAGGAAADAPGDGARPTELKALSRFGSTWARLSVDRQLSRSLAKVPENAGPLNSHHLALRSLTLMRDISPDYLGRFMSYVDALLWLEQAAGLAPPVQVEVASAEVEKHRKPRRRKPA